MMYITDGYDRREDAAETGSQEGTEQLCGGSGG